MIDALTQWLLNLVGLVTTLGVMAAGFLYLLQSPDKAKVLLVRVVAGAFLAAVAIMLMNGYLHALAAGNPVAVGVLVALSFAAYLVRLVKRSDRGPGPQRPLLGR